MVDPLKFTKTYVKAGIALLAVVVILVLIGYWLHGKIRAKRLNPLNRFLIRLYHPLLLKVLPWRERLEGGRYINMDIDR